MVRFAASTSLMIIVTGIAVVAVEAQINSGVNFANFRTRYDIRNLIIAYEFTMQISTLSNNSGF